MAVSGGRDSLAYSLTLSYRADALTSISAFSKEFTGKGNTMPTPSLHWLAQTLARGGAGKPGPAFRSRHDSPSADVFNLRNHKALSSSIALASNSMM